MQIALLLHIYQPPTQFQGLVEAITRQSYEKVVRLLEKYPQARINLNINASLSEQLFDAGYKGLLERMAVLAEKGQIEFTGSAAYHPILPDLSKHEIIRQINLNNKINQSLIGSAYSPVGFFPPEMAYENKVGEVAEKLGFKWMVVDDTGIEDGHYCLDYVYRRKNGRLLYFSRNSRLSYKIAFGKVRTILGLQRSIGVDQALRKKYLVLAMDGETFGHHQPKQLEFLELLFASQSQKNGLKLCRISQLMLLYKKRVEVEVKPSTWGYTKVVDGQRIWVRWRNPDSPLHLLLGRLRSMAVKSVGKGDTQARLMLDRALNSDTFWWASGSPCWHSGMVDRGAAMLCEVVQKSHHATAEEKKEAMEIYSEILKTGFKVFGTRDIAC